MARFTSQQRLAIWGDVTVLALLTIGGFATHLTLDAFGRMLITLLASLLAWGVVAPAVGVYRNEVLTDARSLWRVAWAALLAGPLATFLRGAALDRDIPWVFVVVTILTTAAGLLLWRVAYGWWTARQASSGARSTTSAR
jgi:hypothetical protein